MAKIKVADQNEATLIARGLEYDDVRVLVKIMGALSVIPDIKQKREVLIEAAYKLGIEL